MSKNVAVFVDVANIFYAAKAAGVDIDYVTLLKSAIAGRDFVRAYAYTGLDPENDNQRQFHAFLARNGYRVVSKDIRKYGDGRVKANLDIELVVDLMKTARNLDVAVVVSGDGDFAPAIRAVQETGVRVEVISFRANTSSDLIEVADVFTDITQIARVERGSSRSGRRVAADEDLSMTEVPDKETEGAPRRRRGRGRGTSRPDHVADEAVARDVAHEVAEERTVTRGRAPARGRARGPEGERGRGPEGERAGERGVQPPPPGQLVVLPGERLRRAVAVPVAGIGVTGPDEESALESAQTDESVSEQDVTAEQIDTQPDDTAGRRRRRRGGRGRGRGRGVDGAPSELPEGSDEEEEEPVEAAPPAPPRSVFGSVWDNQLGMPSAPSSSGGDIEEDLEEEPEIPEYLLAERRQRGRSGRGPGQPMRGRGGRAGAYQQALERERFGRSFGSGAPQGPRREPRDRVPQRGGRPAGPERQDRSRPHQVRDPQQVGRPVSQSGDPWTEVPPEIAELLRAEMSKAGTNAQRAPAPHHQRTGGIPPVAEADVTAAGVLGGADDHVEAAPRTRRGGRGRGRGPRTPGAETAGVSGAAVPSETPSGEQLSGVAGPAAQSQVESSPEAAPARRPGGRRKAAVKADGIVGIGASPEAGAATADTGSPVGDAAPAASRAPVRRTRAVAKVAGKAAEAAPAEAAPAETTAAPAPVVARATRARAGRAAAPADAHRTADRRSSGDGGPGANAEVATPPSGGAGSSEAPTPRRRVTRKAKTEPEA